MTMIAEFLLEKKVFNLLRTHIDTIDYLFDNGEVPGGR